jgi:hypothetical protein
LAHYIPYFVLKPSNKPVPRPYCLCSLEQPSHLSAPPARADRTMGGSEAVCEVCVLEGKSEAAKYRCPTCRLRYCSLVCYKTHKQTPCDKETAPTQQPDHELVREPTVVSGWPGMGVGLLYTTIGVQYNPCMVCISYSSCISESLYTTII